MKKIFMVLTVIFFAVFSANLYASAEQWEKVVSNGFGNQRNDYAWSMANFQGKLYVGTLNLIGGAQIWCSGSGESSTWENVYRSFFPGNIGIRCFYADDNQALYAGTFNQQGGAQILKTTDGRRWRRVVRNGFRDRKNTSVRCITRFGEYLYAGTGTNGARLYRSKDGENWEQVTTTDNIESTKVSDPQTGSLITNNIAIGELAVFKDNLYAFTWTIDADLLQRNIDSIMQNSFENNTFAKRRNAYRTNIYRRSLQMNDYESEGAFEVWRSHNGVAWEKVVGKDDPYGNGMGFCGGNPDDLDSDVVTSVAIFNSQLYLGTENAQGNTAVWRTKEGTEWERVIDFPALGEKFNFYIWRMIAFQGHLYISTMNMGPSGVPGVTGAQIWRSDSGEEYSFECIVVNGFDGETITVGNIEMPKNYGVRCFGILDGDLYAGTATMLSIPIQAEGRRFLRTFAGRDTGCEIYKMVP